MRHRYVVNLYSDDHFDAEISDYLTMFGGTKKQELLRTLLRVGYSSLIKHKSNPAAIAAGYSSEELVAVIAMLSANGIINPVNHNQQKIPGESASMAPITHLSEQQVMHHSGSSANRSDSSGASKPQQKSSPNYEITHSDTAAKQYTEEDVVGINDDTEEYVDPLQSFADIPGE